MGKQGLLTKIAEHQLDFSHQHFSQLDLSNCDLRQVQFENCVFEAVNFAGSNLAGANLTNVLCRDCQFSDANLSDSLLIGADLRGCHLAGATIKGANLYTAILEDADLTNIVADQTTQFFALRCPPSGAFVAYKKCFDFRMVQLLVPADAKRSSATNITCRCDKAKVLTIKSLDYRDNYTEAVSYVDGDFVYRVGEVMEAGNYDEDRWADSTGGIHFFMTRAEALNYM